MGDYSKGKIYKLYRVSNKDLVYYGSTIKTLDKRLAKHISDYKINSSCTSKKVLVAGDYKMELIENFPCNSKAELERKEGEYAKNNVCVNEVIAGRTNKEWREDNKKAIAEKWKEYYEKNKEQIAERKKEYVKEYRENNKEIIAKKKKEWYENNKEVIAEKHKEKVTCECGCIINKGDLPRHKKTNKHLEIMQ